MLPTAHSMWLVASTDARLDWYMYMTWLAIERRCDDIITCVPFVTQQDSPGHLPQFYMLEVIKSWKCRRPGNKVSVNKGDSQGWHYRSTWGAKLDLWSHVNAHVWVSTLNKMTPYSRVNVSRMLPPMPYSECMAFLYTHLQQQCSSLKFPKIHP